MKSEVKGTVTSKRLGNTALIDDFRGSNFGKHLQNSLTCYDIES
jgi:hypothetical protein